MAETKFDKALRELCLALNLKRRKIVNGLRTGEWEPIPESMTVLFAALLPLLELFSESIAAQKEARRLMLMFPGATELPGETIITRMEKLEEKWKR